MGKWTIRASMAIALGLTPFLMAAGGEPTQGHVTCSLPEGNSRTTARPNRKERTGGFTSSIGESGPSARIRTALADGYPLRFENEGEEEPKQLDQDRVDTLVWRCRVFDDGRHGRRHHDGERPRSVPACSLGCHLDQKRIKRMGIDPDRIRA